MAAISEIAGSINSSLLWICAIAAALVFAALVYSTFSYRPADRAASSQARGPMRELAWTLVPILIVVAAATPAMKSAVPIRSAGTLVTDARAASLTVGCSPVQLGSVATKIIRTSAPTSCSPKR